MFAVWEKVNDWWNTLTLKSGGAGMTIKTDGSGPSGYEIRIGILGNNTPRPWWRIFFNATGGIEIQNASDELFTDAANVVSLAGQTNINANIDAYGLNLDAGNIDGRVAIRNGDGTAVLGAMRAVGNGQGGFQVIFSARDKTGAFVDLMALDPDQRHDGAMWVQADNAPRRLRRKSNGDASLL